MKKITLIFIAAFLMLSAQAQITWNCNSFIVSCNDTNVVCNTNSTCILTCTITNTSCCSSVNCSQIIDSIMTLPSGWYASMCNPNGCFPPSTTSNTFIIPPSGTVTAKFEIHAGSNPGNADVRVRFEDPAITSNGITFHIVGSTSTGITDNSNNDILFIQNFPNPFTASTTIKYNVEQPNAKLVITDITGKIIFSYGLNAASGEIILSEKMSAGTYFYSIYADEKILASKKMLVQ